MIIRFAVDPAVLTAGNPDVSNHERLVALWLVQHIGVLVDVRGDDGGAFETGIDRILDPGTKKFWQTAFHEGSEGQGRLVHLGYPGPTLLEYTPDIVRRLAPFIDILVTGAGQEGRYGGQVVGSSSVSTTIQYRDDPDSRIEVVPIHAFDRSEIVQNTIRIRGRGNVEEGFPVRTIWRERFMNMFNVCEDVHIVDRYVFSSRGLDRLIEFAKNEAPSKSKTKTMDIYAELPWDDRQNIAFPIHSVTDQVRQWLSMHAASPQPFGEIKIHFIPKGVFSERYKDRYIRFGRLGAVGGGHGVAIFEGRNYMTPDTKGISWNADVSVCQDLEKRLAEKAIPKVATVV